MQVTLSIPDELAARATARGRSVEAYLRGLIEADQSSAGNGLRSIGPGPYTPEEAAGGFALCAPRTGWMASRFAN